jgi:hypothetical protein
VLACGERSSGWQDNACGTFAAPIYFATSATQPIRVTRREDGMIIEQIVLSAAKDLGVSPGQLKNDTMIVPR